MDSHATKPISEDISNSSRYPTNGLENTRDTTREPIRDNATRRIDKNRSIGSHWTPSNLTTLIEWLWTSIYIIECLEISIISSRNTLRYNTILGLVLSTLTGTLNITQFNLIDDYYVNLTIKILLTLMAFAIAVNTGRIKIYQYQESLEDYIRIKQEWIQFAVNIAAELQLPIDLRQDALYIIENYKGKYLDLLKAESEISERVKDRIKKMMEYDDVKFNHLIQKYNYIMDQMEEDKNVDINKLIQEYDQQHLPEQQPTSKTHILTKTKSKRDVSDKEIVNRMVKNFLNGNQVSVYGVKISNLILNLVFKEKFDLNILQRQDFYDTDIDLIILYDKLSLNNLSESAVSAQSSERRSEKKTHMPMTTSRSTKARMIPRLVSEVNDIPTNTKLNDPEIRIVIDSSK
jgi:uncharacterized membrane protein (DUF441 family)